MAIKKPDDQVGSSHETGPGGQTPGQAAVLGGGGEEGGLPEPKSAADWSARGASGGVAGRPQVALGGNSGGHGDRMPTGGATGSNATASNPKTRPGHGHEA